LVNSTPAVGYKEVNSNNLILDIKYSEVKGWGRTSENFNQNMLVKVQQYYLNLKKI
jgi:hypothetical protein